MSTIVWGVRAGSAGEHEQKFLDDNRIYVTWYGLRDDLSGYGSQSELRDLLQTRFPDYGPRKVMNHASQLWPFAHEMKAGDWAVVPSKRRSSIHIAEIIGDYVFDPGAPDPYFHWRDVRWVATDVPRANFDLDVLHTLGAFMTIFRVRRNGADKRIRAMAERGWRSGLPGPELPSSGPDDDVPAAGEPSDANVDLEEVGRDQIVRLVSQRFKAEALEELVDALLRAQGYQTWRSPKGADKGVDILAAPGSLGFGRPRLCVQVKSSDSPVGREVLDQLVGTMQSVQAEQGLLVSWGGFRTTVEREIPSQFFRVRLWDARDLIDELLRHYEQLDEEIRAQIPLKHVWVVATSEEPN